jgi:hypothetical protein
MVGQQIATGRGKTAPVAQVAQVAQVAKNNPSSLFLDTRFRRTHGRI